MNRYAIDHSRGRVVLPAADPDQARAKMAKLYGAGRYEPIQLTTNANPATGVATTPKTMTMKKSSPTKKSAAPAASKPAKGTTKKSLGDRVVKLAEPKRTTVVEPAIRAGKTKALKAAKEGMSGLDAAALVLKEAKAPMGAKEIVAAIQERKLAPKLGGATPHATIYAAMITEIAKKGAESRFARASEKGKFTAA